VEAGVARIGANVTLARLAADPELRRSHLIVADAAGHAATPQRRAMATLGGNLVQRPRCWYFRSETFPCRKKGGATCFAQDGDSSLHAIFGNGVCAAPHPSTIATALVALGARVAIAGKRAREVELAGFFVAPEADLAREVDLAPGELITGVTLPAAPANLRTAYTKQVAKQSFDWPIRRRRRRARHGRPRLPPGNDHKVPILEAVVARTILAAASGAAGSQP
jgi:xanthine dehydrogenase YagS FAD-binding subunit